MQIAELQEYSAFVCAQELVCSNSWVNTNKMERLVYRHIRVVYLYL